MSTSKSRVRPAGPRALKGSQAARRSATVILEALTGLRSTPEAAEALGVALPRYYVLETRALEGFICALEPRARGRQRTSEHELRELRAEVVTLEREVRRYQALHRSAQRALGVPKAETVAKASRGAKKKAAKRRRKQTRGERILRVLKAEDEARSAQEAPKQAEAGA